MATYHVYHIPHGESTVDSIRVIDAWSTEGSMEDAFSDMRSKLQEYSNTYGDGRVQLYQADADNYSSFLPPSQTDLIFDMAKKAMPKSDDDEEYEDANAFFDLLSKRFPLYFDDRSDFSVYCLKATPAEMVIEALRILRERLGIFDDRKALIQKLEWDNSTAHYIKTLKALSFEYQSFDEGALLVRKFGKHIITITDENALFVPNLYEKWRVSLMTECSDGSWEFNQNYANPTRIADDFYDALIVINDMLLWS